MYSTYSQTFSAESYQNNFSRQNCAPHVTVFVFTTFDVIFDLILNIHKAEWNLVGRVISLISRAVFFFLMVYQDFYRAAATRNPVVEISGE